MLVVRVAYFHFLPVSLTHLAAVLDSLILMVKFTRRPTLHIKNNSVDERPKFKS